jgi:hypothetical protein
MTYYLVTFRRLWKPLRPSHVMLTKTVLLSHAAIIRPFSRPASDS